jgi:hypothetical protein
MAGHHLADSLREPVDGWRGLVAQLTSGLLQMTFDAIHRLAKGLIHVDVETIGQHQDPPDTLRELAAQLLGHVHSGAHLPSVAMIRRLTVATSLTNPSMSTLISHRLPSWCSSIW